MTTTTTATAGTHARVLAVFERLTAETGVPPTMHEIMAATGIRSTCTVHYQLNRLVRDGALVTLGPLKRRRYALPRARLVTLLKAS